MSVSLVFTNFPVRLHVVSAANPADETRPRMTCCAGRDFQGMSASCRVCGCQHTVGEDSGRPHCLVCGTDCSSNRKTRARVVPRPAWSTVDGDSKGQLQPYHLEPYLQSLLLRPKKSLIHDRNMREDPIVSVTESKDLISEGLIRPRANSTTQVLKVSTAIGPRAKSPFGVQTRSYVRALWKDCGEYSQRSIVTMLLHQRSHSLREKRASFVGYPSTTSCACCSPSAP